MMAQPASVTSIRRFAAAFALSALASACIPFLITPLIIGATGGREAGMVIGVPVGVMMGWLVFPLIAWRPFRIVHLLALPLVVLVVVAGFAVLPEHWITSLEGDRNGVFGGLVNAALCALLAFGALTWARNRRLAAGKS